MPHRKRQIGKAQRIAAALATALAASMAASDSTADDLQDAVRSVERYCVASWRAAGIPRQEWDDCTQEVLARLLERLPRPTATSEQAYRELKRAVWSTAKAYRRRPRGQLLHEGVLPDPSAPTDVLADAEWIEMALQHVTDRQRRILELWLAGARVSEIARELNLPVERVSDEKYKAIQRIRRALAGTDVTAAQEETPTPRRRRGQSASDRR